MRQMYDKYSKSGYTQQEFRAMASEVAGANLDDWFTNAIDSTNELDFSEVGVLGIEVNGFAKEISEAKSEDEDAESTTEDSNENVEQAKDDQESPMSKSEDDQEVTNAAEPDTQESKPWVGIGETASGPSVIVSSVAPDSPAYQAGIQTDDELIAVNDFRLSGVLSERLEQFDVGFPVEFLLSRRGQLLRIDVTPALENEFDWNLEFVKDPNAQQNESLQTWLGK